MKIIPVTVEKHMTKYQIIKHDIDVHSNFHKKDTAESVDCRLNFKNVKKYCGKIFFREAIFNRFLW